MRKPCPYCFKFISTKDETCPHCKKELKKKKKKVDYAITETTEENLVTSLSGETTISPNLERLARESEAINPETIEATTEEKKEEITKDIYHQKNGRIKWVPKKKRDGYTPKKKITSPRITGVHINVESSSYFERKRNKYNPSPNRLVGVNDAGKYEMEKLKWWEIYRWADRQLAKNKINKIVKKESLKRPEKVSYWVLFFLTLFSGFVGIHNFYAGNTKRGVVSSSCFGLAFFFVIFLNGIKFFNMYMQGLLCAIPGLICLFIWVSDFIAIIFKRFKYSKSKIEFIKTLDIETRARLGKKYIYIV